MTTAIDPLAGRSIGGFDVIARLGAGGMGAVYRATQRSLGRTVALKILDPALANRPDFAERFRREARAAARLDHPHVVQPIDFGEADGYHFFAMELMEGGSASARLDAQGPFSEREALEIALGVARALAYARPFGIVHRDIKPDNILFSKHGTPKLADLGLVFDKAAPGVTEQGIAMGSPHYMSPEQAMGRRDLDSRSDIYSLGATLYELVSGVRPFEGPSAAAILTAHVSTPMPDVRTVAPGVSEHTAALIARMCAKRREDRFQTPEDLIAAIEAALRALERGADRATSAFPLAAPVAPPRASEAAGTAALPSTGAGPAAAGAAPPSAGRRALPILVAAALVLGIGVVLHFGLRGPADADPAAEAATRAALRELLRTRRSAGGGYGFASDAKPDPWTTAQAFTALALGAETRRTDADELATLLEKLAAFAIDGDPGAAKLRGWASSASRDQDAMIEASAWAALAIAVAGDDFRTAAGPLERERARRFLLGAQALDGGFPTVFGLDAPASRTTATGLALAALVALSAHGEPSPEALRAIHRAAAWLGAGYDAKEHAWFPNPKRRFGNRRRIEGLSEHVAWALLEAELVLARAKHELPSEARAALDDFAAHPELGAEQPVDLLAQSEVEDYIFERPGGETLVLPPVRWVYWSWRALAAERLVEQRPAHARVPAWRAEARRLRARGVGLEKKLAQAQTFQIAECLAAANLLARQPPGHPERGSLFLLLAEKRSPP